MFKTAANNMNAFKTPTCHKLADMFGNTVRFTATMGIRSTRSISELMGVSYTRLSQRKKSRGDKSGYLEAKRLDHHAQSSCLEMSGSNGQVHIYHNEMMPVLLKPHAASKRCRDIGKQFQKSFLLKDELLVRVQSRR
ncbi:hypothetical protein TNCV_2095111 [Trichonephila clavipes]|nr:hypothetical protein TNCV_2095111 [Trichonephila clavipes]